MKKTLACILFFLLFPLLSLAEGNDLARQVESILHATYGFTEEEASRFAIAIRKMDGQYSAKAVHPEHTAWVYGFEWEDPAWGPRITSPFTRSDISQWEYFLRTSLREMEGMIGEWETWGRESFLTYLWSSGQLPNIFPVQQMLSEISPAQGVDILFYAAMGPQGKWTPALWQWRSSVLAAWQLEEAEEAKNFSVAMAAPHSADPEAFLCRVLQFEGDIPAQYASIFAHPMLEGWQFLSGALWEYEGERAAAAGNRGMALFGQGEKRLVIQLHQDHPDHSWQLFPAGEIPFLAGKEISVNPRIDKYSFFLDISLSETESESIALSCLYHGGGKGYCNILSYTRVNRETGEGVQIADDRMVLYGNGRAPESIILPGEILGYLNFLGDRSLPATEEECLAFDALFLPEGYAMIQGVHLRQKTSSHSADLGSFYGGAIVEILGTEKGEPFPWKRVRIGDLEGYIAANYVGDIAGMSGARLQDLYLLPVAKATKETALRESSHLLAGKKAELLLGTKMHVLGERGDWYYVCIPREEPGQFMDMDGTCGFILKKDVITAGTALQLDWMDP